MRLNVMIEDYGGYDNPELIKRAKERAIAEERQFDMEEDVHDYLADFVEQLHKPGSKGLDDLSVYSFTVELDGDDIESAFKALNAIEKVYGGHRGPFNTLLRLLLVEGFTQGRKHAIKEGLPAEKKAELKEALEAYDKTHQALLGSYQTQIERGLTSDELSPMYKSDSLQVAEKLVEKVRQILA